MADQAHEWTDDQIEELGKRFAKSYRTAEREMREKMSGLMEQFERDNVEWRERVRTGEVTQGEYDEWLGIMSRDRAFVGGLADMLARDASNANRKAVDAINDTIPEVYAENANYAAYGVESGLGYDTHSFDLVDESTVRRLIMEQPELLPPIPEPKVNEARDKRWNRQKFAGAITQSVLQGESVPKAAERVGRVMRMNERAAMRAARTALTGAENAGRVDSYRRADRMGIKLEQQWIATLDERTRIEHRLLDKQHKPVGERFEPFGYGPKYSIGFPGDPTALGAMVYNCRCTLVAWLPDIEKQDPSRWSKLPKGMTYDKWKDAKSKEPRTQDVPRGLRAFTNRDNPIWSQLGPVDADAVASRVEQMLSGAKGHAAEVWAKYEDRLRMTDPTNRRGAFYRPSDGGVHMNVQRSLDNTSGRGTLSTWFHEFGHNIDYLAGSDMGSRKSLTVTGERFGKTISDEVASYVKARQKELVVEFGEMIEKRDVKGMMRRRYLNQRQNDAQWRYMKGLKAVEDDNSSPTWMDESTWRGLSVEKRRDALWDRFIDEAGLQKPKVSLQKARDIVGDEITKGGKDTQLALGDVFEGATRGKCRDTYGHGKSYWDANDESLAKEAFAEFFSAECIYSERPEILNEMIRALPESYKVYTSIMEGLLK